MSEVTQTDRQAAADVADAAGWAERALLIRAGRRDNEPMVQAFARHRTIHTAPLIAAMERAAEAIKALPVEQWIEQDPRDGTPHLIGYVMQCQGEWDEARAALTDLTAAIRAGKGET